MLPFTTYLSNHTLQKRDVNTLLQNYKEKIRWTIKQKIIDIGCGPGDVTNDFLLPLVPSIGELVGIDTSQPMIDFANTRYSNLHSSFQVIDITESEVAEKYPSYFDSAFSFYCLNWVQNQRMAMKNIHSILKPGGETLCIFVVDTINYLLFETLAKSPKWSPYMMNYEDSISPYRNSPDPASDVRNLMQALGFQVDDCLLELLFYTFPSKEVFFNWVNGVNPFLKNIPDHLLEEFDRAWKEIVFSDDSCFLDEKTNQVTISYSTITVFARKQYQYMRKLRVSLPEILYDKQKWIQTQTYVEADW